ncbi:lactadherin-like [Diadema antillarum]|uniref:lactadherin-like n=1 Tax=Diadema antillarum TaxID=105358 RepID=UPI003A84145C
MSLPVVSGKPCNVAAKRQCGASYNLNYTLHMNRRCPVAEINGMDVQLIPKLTGHQARPGNCRANADHGYRVCRIPDCLSMPCKNGYCEETMYSYTCHCQPGYTGPYCETEIPMWAKALGMESGSIPDTSITASSLWLWFDPKKGRLNYRGAWAPKTENSSWIQVELEHPTCIVGLATQGQWRNDQWVKAYKVGCGLEAGDIVMVTENSPFGVSEKIFSANTDSNTVVYNSLPEPHLCRFVQVHPVSWYDYPSMRIELYTGSVNSETWNVSSSLSTTLSSCSPLDNVLEAVMDDLTIQGSLEIPALAKALGMEAHTIPDMSITASSFFSSQFTPQQGRLNAYGGWSPTFSINSWIQVELDHPTCVVGLATQGTDYSKHMWIKEYKVGCGQQAYSIVMVTEKSSDGVSEKIFSANTDASTVVYNGLPEPHLCRFVQVRPVSWSKHVSLRMELYTVMSVV